MQSAPVAIGEPDPALAEAVDLAGRLAALGLPRPLEIGVAAPEDPTGFWLRLEDFAPRILLGRDDLDARLRALARVLEAAPPEAAGAATLDLRFADQVVLRGTPPGNAGGSRDGAAQGCGRVRARSVRRTRRLETRGGETVSRQEDLIVGLDIGTTKICVIVADRTENGIDVVGIGTHPSRGLRKGVVVDIDATVDSIKHAVEEAELMADCEITSVFAGIAGGHIRGFNSHGVVAVKDREVREGDVKRVIDAAKAVAIPMDREVIHVIPQEFIIDDQDGIREPLGMSGVRLEAKIHIVTAAVTSAQNIVKCANKAGLNVIDIVLEPLASAEACLAEDERELGVCLIDMGGGTTDLAVFADGAIKHTSVLGLGGYHISNDIAVGLRTPFEEAERIKKKFGVAAARFLTQRRRDQRALRGRAPPAPGLAQDPVRDHRAAGGRDPLARAADAGQGRAGGPDSLRCRAHRGLLRARGLAGAGGGDLRGPRPPGHPDPHRRAPGRGAQPHVRHRGRAHPVRCGPDPRRIAYPVPDPRRVDLRPGQAADAGLVLRGFRVKKAWRVDTNSMPSCNISRDFDVARGG